VVVSGINPRTAAGAEPNRPVDPVAEQAVRRAEGGVPAQIDLAHRSEPPQPEVCVRIIQRHDEGGLGQVHLHGQRLHPGIGRIAAEYDDASWIPGECVVSKGIHGADTGWRHQVRLVA
jgi:hypothetical protein